MRHVATHLAGLGVLLAAFIGAGALIEYVLPSLRSVRTSVGLVRLTLGIIVWIGLLFALAVLGVLRAPVVGVSAGVAILIGTLILWRDRLAETGGFREAWREISRPDLAAVVLAAPIIVVLALVFVSLTPYVGWDDNVAHLTLPRLYLANSGFRRVPFNIYSNWPLNIQLLYALAMLVQDYILAKLIHLMFLVLIVIAVYRLAAAHSSRLGGGFAAAFLLANPVILDEARFAYIDIAFAFFFLMAFVFALQHLDERRILPLVLAGVCCGIVAGTKLMGAVAAPSIGLLVVVGRTAPSRTAALGTALRDVALFVALPAFVLALPWYVRSYAYTGNPFYPLFYQWFGGPEWNVELERQFFDWQQSIGMGRRLVDYVLLPVRVALEGGIDYAHFDGRVNPLWVVLVPFSLLVTRTRVVRQCLGLAGLYFLTWALTSQQARFLIPMLPLLAVAAGVALATTWDRLAVDDGPRRAAYHACVVTAASMALLWPARFLLLDGFAAARQVLGRNGITVPGDAKAPIYRFISDELPPTARLMMLNTNQGFFVDREYIADSFFEASQINALLLDGSVDAVDVLRRLRDLGITHVLLAKRDWGIPYPPALWEFLEDRRLTEPVYRSTDGEYVVFRLRGVS